MEETLTIERLYTGEDGHSYFETINIPLQNKTAIGLLSEKIPTSNIEFRYTSGDYDLALHNAPRRQYIIMIEGGVEITTSKGVTKRFQSGSKNSVLLVEDVTGYGHHSKAIDKQPRYSLFIWLSDA
jgi:hypothetical protein